MTVTEKPSFSCLKSNELGTSDGEIAHISVDAHKAKYYVAAKKRDKLKRDHSTSRFTHFRFWHKANGKEGPFLCAFLHLLFRGCGTHGALRQCLVLMH